MIEQDLRQLGLSDNEISVYLSIVRHGKISPGAIANLTKIKRTTIYNILKTLKDKQLIVEDLGGTTTYILPSPFEEFYALVGREERKVERKKRSIYELLPQLVQLAGSSKYTIPRIRFIDEKHINKHLRDATPTWNQSILENDGVWWGFQDKTFVRQYESWIDWYWEQPIHNSVHLKLLSNESAEIIKKKKFANRQIKFWKKGDEFSATTWINGDFVVMITTSQRPHYLVEIHDRILAHNMRQLFKGIWEEI